MEKKKYGVYDKLDMVLMVLKNPKKKKEIAGKYGVGSSTLYKWLNRFLSGGQEELKNYKTGFPPAQISTEEKELREKVKRYEKRIAELSAELEIIKKNENGKNVESA